MERVSARSRAALLALYALSGIAALAYQVLWARALALQFGVSVFGVVVTTAAFMIGLGAGSLVGTRLAGRVRSPLRIFAALEASVAVYAMLLPLLQNGADALLGPLLSGAPLPVWHVALGFTALWLLTLPAFALGLGFPLVLQAGARLGVGLGSIYGVNTLGGAFGALLPLLILPWLGWSTALVMVASLGLLVAAAAWWLSGLVRVDSAPSPHPLPVASGRPAWSTVLAYAGVGAGALLLEVAWVRLFGMIFLRTEYVLAIILCVFLAGLGGGSLIAHRYANVRWLDWFPVVIAAAALLGLAALPWLARWGETAHFASLGTALLGQGALLALVTLPVTLILGAWLPVLANSFSAHEHSGPWLYGANSLGAALGALAGGVVVFPWLGTAAAIVLAAALLFGCGMLWCARRRLWLAALPLALMAVPLWTLPGVAVLLPSSQAASRDLAVQEDAINITHVVEQSDGQRLLLADLQRMDASSEPSAVISQQNQARLPLLLHAQPHSILFLGLGTGVTAAGTLGYPDLQRTAVELSPGAMVAAREWFREVNGGVTEQTAVVWDDARRFLQSTHVRYDVIAGDLFHPDLVGRSSLLSVQQFRRARDRLTPGGVFVQWVALNQFDRDTLQTIWRGFGAVFPGACAFLDGFRLAFVGVNGQRPNAAAALANLARLTPAQQRAATGAEGAWTWLGRYWGSLPIEPGPVQDEWWPRIEYALPRLRYGGAAALPALLEWLLKSRPRVDAAAAALGVAASDYAAFERAYIATDLATRSYLAALRGQDADAQRLLRLAFEANRDDRWIASGLADQMFASLSQALAAGRDERQALEAILRVYPDHVPTLQRLFALLQASDAQAALELAARLRALSPLDTQVRALPVATAPVDG